MRFAITGAIATCALPWLTSLPLQHASFIMSEEASLITLSSLYQQLTGRHFCGFTAAESLQDALKQMFLIDAIDANGTITSIGKTMVNDNGQTKQITLTAHGSYLVAEVLVKKGIGCGMGDPNITEAREAKRQDTQG
nr:probable pre-mRNA-splicing factor ATP-dependent RNA helicase DEAH4 [Tanacetum cinerariifolium]